MQGGKVTKVQVTLMKGGELKCEEWSKERKVVDTELFEYCLDVCCVMYLKDDKEGYQFEDAVAFMKFIELSCEMWGNGLKTVEFEGEDYIRLFIDKRPDQLPNAVGA